MKLLSPAGREDISTSIRNRRAGESRKAHKDMISQAADQKAALKGYGVSQTANECNGGRHSISMGQAYKVI